MLWPPNNY